MKMFFRTSVKFIFLCLIAATLCACSSPAAPAKSLPAEASDTAIKEGAFITIDINPKIELVIDEKHVVTAAYAVNSDAEVLLWQEDLIGADIETALERIASAAVELGYLSPDNASVSVTVTTDHGKTEEALLATIDETMVQAVKKAGLEIRVEEAVDLVLSKELARIKEENVGKPGYDDTLTISRFRLIRAALQADRELTMDEAVLMTGEELTEIVETARADATAKLGHAYESAEHEAAFIYENAKQTLLDSAYTAIYAERRDLSALFGNHGASYAACRLAYRTVAHYADTLRDLVENPIFTSNDVFALANALGIDTSVEAEYEAFKQELRDEEGNITKESINAYIERRYRNMDEEDRVKLEQAYDEIMEMFDRLGAEASIIREDGRMLIQGALFGLGISVSFETYEDLPALLEAIEKKTDEVYTRMQDDLTENEKAKVQDMQEHMSEKIAEFEKSYRQTMEQAEAEAEAYLNEARKERLN